MSDCDRPINLDEYVKMSATEPNLWWKLGSGHHLNLLDEALERLDEQASEIERLRLQIRTDGHLTCEDELDVTKQEKAAIELHVKQKNAALDLRVNQLETEVGHLQADLAKVKLENERLRGLLETGDREECCEQVKWEYRQEVERLRAELSGKTGELDQFRQATIWLSTRVSSEELSWACDTWPWLAGDINDGSSGNMATDSEELDRHLREG